MATTTRSTRRSFIAVAGAALSTPLVAAGASLPGAAADGDSLQARLARLEDEHAIRALNDRYAKHVGAAARDDLAALFDDPSHARLDEGVCGLTSEASDPADASEIAADRRSAVARVHWTVHTETVIGPSCTVVEMARLQGGGVVQAAEPAVFENRYVRRDDGTWRLRAATRVARAVFDTV